MPDAAAPGPSLTVLGGPLKGRRFSLGPQDTLVGSDPTCQISIPVPSVSPVHARIRNTPGGFRVQDGPSASGLYINDDRVTSDAALHDSDVLWLGAPGEPTSVMLSLHLPAPAAPTPEPETADEFLIDEATMAAPTSAQDDFFVPGEEETVVEPPTEIVEAEAAEEFVLEEGPSAPDPDEVFFVDEGAVSPAVPAEPVHTAAPEPDFEPSANLAFEEDAAFMVSEPEPPPAPPSPKVSAPPPVSPSPPRAPSPSPPAPKAPAPSAPAIAAPAATPKAPAPAAAPAPDPSPVFPAPQARPSAKPQAREAPPAQAARPARATGPRPAAAQPPRPSSGPRQETARPKPTSPARRAQPSEGAAPRGRFPKALLVGGLVIAVGGGAFIALRGGSPVLASVSPDRAKVGQTVVISGHAFGATPSATSVFFGERKANIVSATPTRIEAQVPPFPILAGRDSKVDVTVDVGGRKTSAVSIAVYEGPRVDGLAPDVALPGEELELAGAGWGSQATVRFGQVQAEILSNSPSSIRVRVPALDVAPGTQLDVVVLSAGEQSNAAPFLIGRLPIVSKIEPSTAGPGDAVTVTGRGFRRKSAENLVKVGGVRAFVSQSNDNEVRFILPWMETGGELPVEVHVKGVENVGRTSLTVTPPSGDVIDLHFVIEPLPVEDSADHDHAVIATELGPVFVISGGQGRTAADRAAGAVKALNAAAGPLKASLEADFSSEPPRLLLLGKPDTVLEAASEDAQAYGEDWTHAGARNRGGSPGRLAVWWSAIARDLVLLLVRGQKPQYAVALAPEGRVLVDIYQAAHKTGRFGVPRSVLSDMKPPVAEQMRALALRLPASIPEPATGDTKSGPGMPTLQLQGVWRGSEVLKGERNFLTITFQGKDSSAQLGRGLIVDVLNLQTTGKDGARFVLPIQGERHYLGTWDGQKLTGTISSDPGGKNLLGTFELVPGQ